MKFEEATLLYLTTRSLRAQSRRTYETYFRKYLREQFGQMEIEEIQKADIEQFLLTLNNQLSAKHANDVIRFARAVCKRQHDSIPNPFSNIKFLDDRLSDEASRIDPFTREEIQLILQSLPQRWFPVFAFLAFTGMRPSEAIALRWQDLDSSRAIVHVRASRVKGVESSKEPREVLLTDKLLLTLENLRSTNEQTTDEDHIFVNVNNQPINKTLDRHWRKALLKVKLRHRSSAQLRHSYVALCLQAGIKPEWVAKQVGYSNLNAFHKFYSSFIPKNVDVNEVILSSLF